jgi:hypothetical protein
MKFETRASRIRQEENYYLLTLGFLFFLFLSMTLIIGCREKEGPPGPVGPSGQSGSDGTNGTNGSDGTNGLSGKTGPVGPNGPVGPSAEPCSVAEGRDGALVTCNGQTVAVNNGLPGAVGATGATGAIGPTGPSGADGAQGAVGATGTPGTKVTAVKLCADSTSAFPEYGVQIGSNLYAVYWGPLNGDSTSQAFLALLTPGAYESTNGSGCLFTVNADGSITN